VLLAIHRLVSRVSCVSFTASLATMSIKAWRYISKHQVRLVPCVEDMADRGFVLWGDGLQVDMRNLALGIGCANYVVFNPQLNQVYMTNVIVPQLAVCQSRICVLFVPRSCVAAVEILLFQRPASRL
jgi:hypothetical protein